MADFTDYFGARNEQTSPSSDDYILIRVDSTVMKLKISTLLGMVSTTGVDHYRGSYNASSNLFPTTGGNMVGGAPMAGDEWVFSAAGTFNGDEYPIGTIAKALVSTPGQTFANWRLIS